MFDLYELLGKRFGISRFRSLAGISQYRNLWKLVSKHVSPSADVLDWGCGNGHFTYFLHQSGYSVTGYYVYGQCELQKLLEESGCKVVRGHDSVKLPFQDESFDAVASVGVLEHVRETGGNEPDSLRELARVLRPKGIIICYHLPNRHSWIDLVGWRLRFLSLGGSHPYRYTMHDIERLTIDAGLKLMLVARYGSIPRNPLGMLPKKLRESISFAAVWDSLDKALQFVLSPICQNYLFVAQKNSSSSSRILTGDGKQPP